MQARQGPARRLRGQHSKRRSGRRARLAPGPVPPQSAPLLCAPGVLRQPPCPRRTGGVQVRPRAQPFLRVPSPVPRVSGAGLGQQWGAPHRQACAVLSAWTPPVPWRRSRASCRPPLARALRGERSRPKEKPALPASAPSDPHPKPRCSLSACCGALASFPSGQKGQVRVPVAVGEQAPAQPEVEAGPAAGLLCPKSEAPAPGWSARRLLASTLLQNSCGTPRLRGGCHRAVLFPRGRGAVPSGEL